MINATAKWVSKSITHTAWQQVAAEAARPTSDFANQAPSWAQPGHITTGLPMSPPPLRPGSPTAPVNNTPGTIKPSDFSEPDIGWANGLKTGLKALVNATADTGAGLVSLGQWDPPDLWKVQPNDLWYEEASIAARVASEVGLAAATGGASGLAGRAGWVGRVGQVARAADHWGAAGNVVAGVQGAGNIAANGVNLQNGMQVAAGVLGVGQLNGAAKAARAEQVAMESVAAADSRILFGQRRISAKFGDGEKVPTHLRDRPIKDVVKELVDKKMSPDQIEISYTRTLDGELATINNRGLAALSLANLKPTNVKFIPWDELPDEVTRRFYQRPLLKDKRIPGDCIPMTVILPDGRHKILTVVELVN